MSYLTQIYNKGPVFLQTVLLNCKAMELYIERYGKKFRRLFEEFDRNQWLSAGELEEYQTEKLKDLIKHAYETVPYYSRVMRNLKIRPSDIRTPADLHKLPILKREDILHNFKDLTSTKINKLYLRHGHTSGTTGSPLDLCYDIKTCVAHHAADWRQKKWAGLNYGEPYASLQGRVIVPTEEKKQPFWRKNYINNQLFLSSFHLKSENIPYYFDKLHEDDIKFIEGYPSTIYILAMYLNEAGRSFPLDAVLTSSETLFDYQREAIESAFTCRVFDFYGMAERVIFATECDHHRGHHLNMDYGITEILDSNEEPLPSENMGRIVATSLHNHAMPLIRYQTNDTSSFRTERCTCGRTFPLMDDVATKDESIITLPDGRLISPSVLTHPFKPMHNIVESQIIQEELDLLVVRIVKKPEYGRDDEMKLMKAFQERLGAGVRIRIDYLEQLPRTKQGKFKWVISTIKPTFPSMKPMQ